MSDDSDPSEAMSLLDTLCARTLEHVAEFLIGFRAAETFSGPRPGTVFKLGPLGLGYYRDGYDSDLRSARASAFLQSLLDLGASCRQLRGTLQAVEVRPRLGFITERLEMQCYPIRLTALNNSQSKETEALNELARCVNIASLAYALTLAEQEGVDTPAVEPLTRCLIRAKEMQGNAGNIIN